MVDMSCLIGAALTVVFLFAALAFLSNSPVSLVAGPDATNDDMPTADGEPRDVPDSVITVYAPDHLYALGYVVVPSQQHRVRLDCSESEARS